VETTIPDDVLRFTVCAHLDELQREMSQRFRDLLMIKVPDWMINPLLDVDSEDAGVVEEEQLGT